MYLDAISVLVKLIETTNADMAVGNYKRKFSKLFCLERFMFYNDKLTIPEGTQVSLEENKEIMVDLYVAVWGKLYKKKIFDNASLRFNPELAYNEDTDFTLRVLNAIKTIAYVDKNLLVYTMHHKNLSVQTTLIEKMFREIRILYKKTGVYEKFSEELEYITIYHLLIGEFCRMSANGASADTIKRYVQKFDRRSIYKNKYFQNKNKLFKIYIRLLLTYPQTFKTLINLFY